MFGVRCGGMGRMWCAVGNDADEKYEGPQDAGDDMMRHMRIRMTHMMRNMLR